MFINKLTFKKDLRCYKAGEEIVFPSQTTVITGDNGSGKSTLLSSIRSCFKTDWTQSDDPACKNAIELDTPSPENHEIAYLCLTSDLLKTAASLDDDIALHLRLMKMSSGEGSLEQIINKIESNKDKKLLILDEPERGLSEKRVKLLYLYILKHALENRQQQIIIVTHSEIMMRASSNHVYSTSHKKYVMKDEYFEWLRNHRSMSPFAD